MCLFSLVGIDNCPGCGLGKSISMIFHGDFVGSFNAHPLGIPAILLIVKRNIFDAEGLYFIKVSNGEFVIVKPIIIVE